MPRLFLLLTIALGVEAAVYYFCVQQGYLQFARQIFLPTCAWVMLIIAGLSSFRSCYNEETARGAFFGRIISPVDSLALLLGKSMAAFFALFLTQAVVLAAHCAALVTDVPIDITAIFIILFLSVLGFSITGAAVFGCRTAVEIFRLHPSSVFIPGCLSGYLFSNTAVSRSSPAGRNVLVS